MQQPVLIIENDPFNCLNIRQMLLACGLESPLIHAGNGEGALLYLKRQYQELPCLIVLDLDSPVIGGIEFLYWLQSDDRLKGIPVVVMIHSHRSVAIPGRLGVADRVVKSDDYRRFSDEMGLILQKWFKDRPAA